MTCLNKRSTYRICREVHDTYTCCERVCNRRVVLLEDSADLSGLWSRDQMDSTHIGDGPLNEELAEEVRWSQLGDTCRRRYSSPTAIALERISAAH